MSPPKKKYVYCFTAYNVPCPGAHSSSDAENRIKRYDPNVDYSVVIKWLAGGGMVKLACVQLERAPETGRLHYQGVVRFNDRLTLGAAIDAMKHSNLAGCHLEPTKGSFQDNLNYCSKSDSRMAGPWYLGDVSHPEEVDIEDKPQLQRSQSKTAADLSQYINLVPPKWRFITVCWGPPAIGKSYIWGLIGEYIGGGVYKVPAKAKNSNGRWVGDYKGEQMAIIDEYDYDNDFENSQWKLLLDRKPQMVPGTMGGKSVLWCPQVIVLLSNHAIGPGHPFTDMVFRTRFSEVFNDWNWIYTEVGVRYPRLASPVYNAPIEIHGTIDLYPAYIPPSERSNRKRKSGELHSVLDPPTVDGSQLERSVTPRLFGRGTLQLPRRPNSRQSSSSSSSSAAHRYSPSDELIDLTDSQIAELSCFDM